MGDKCSLGALSHNLDKVDLELAKGLDVQNHGYTFTSCIHQALPKGNCSVQPVFPTEGSRH